MRGAALALCVALALSGCGLGPGEERRGGAELRITRDFGAERLASVREERVPEGQTVMRFLQSERTVETRYGGGFVDSIDGLSGGGPTGRRDWFYFVNGIEAEVGAADHELSPGDVVTWDYRSWEAAMSVPAIVGAYPEPFLNGRDGKRLPTRVECEDPAGRACEEVRDRLAGQDVAATGAALGSSAGPDVIRVVVAAWPVARRTFAARTLEEGPDASGVFARFADGGRRLELLDETGGVATVAPPGTGLVAATSLREQGVVWLVTGVDAAGVEAGARGLDEEILRDAFAVAVTPSGPVRLPVREGRT